jgi:ABC-type nitrate/sulfonate/bicarbonate transport system permease component
VGVKIGLTLAMTGAIVGEFVAADAGLGYLMNLGRTDYDAPMVFAAALTMAGIAIAGYVLATRLEHMLLAWE